MLDMVGWLRALRLSCQIRILAPPWSLSERAELLLVLHNANLMSRMVEWRCRFPKKFAFYLTVSLFKSDVLKSNSALLQDDTLLLMLFLD